MNHHTNTREVLPPGLSIAGDLSAEEDVTLSGRFDGQIKIPAHHLSIEASAAVKARIVARAVTIAGSLEGTILATGSVEITKGASVRAHVTSGALTLEDGAHFTGTVDPKLTEAAMRVARYRERQA
jgi:cytoskeletal protein CcmA (bactofilin family)